MTPTGAGAQCRVCMNGSIAALDDGSHVLEDDEAARTLRQAMTDLLADDLVLFGRKALRLGVGYRDGLYRHHGRVEVGCIAAAVGEVGEVAAGLAARVCGHGAASFGLLGGRGKLAQQWPQVHLLRIGFGGEALAPFAQQPLPNN